MGQEQMQQMLENLQMTWTILQYWVRRAAHAIPPRNAASARAAIPPAEQVIGFMMLCVFLVLREGLEWWGMLSHWLINMAFSLLFMDLVFCYIRFQLWATLLPLKDRLTGAPRFRSK